MRAALETFLETSRNAGISVTKPRLLVFTILHTSGPVTMNELAAACAGKIDRVSVYRTVSLFEQLSIAHKIHSGWKYKIELSDNYQAHHHHMTCSSCGAITSLPEDRQLEAQLVAAAEKQGFTAVGHQLEISGICKRCI